MTTFSQAASQLLRGGGGTTRPPGPIVRPPAIPLPETQPAPAPAPPVAAPPQAAPTPGETAVPDAADEPFAGDQSSYGDAVRLENRTRTRERRCCNPTVFLTEWLKETKPLGNNHDVRINFTDRDFRIFSGYQVVLKRGFRYQFFMCGPLEYKANSESGAYVWADGELSALCWLREAKYQMPAIMLPPGAVYTPQIEQADRNTIQFSNYANVCNNPKKPGLVCWQIGVEVIVSRRGGPVTYYYELLARYGIRGVVRWAPIAQEGIQELENTNRNLKRKNQQ